MSFTKPIGLLWIPCGAFGAWATIESAPRWALAWAAGAFFTLSAWMGYRLFLGRRFALRILCLQSAIIVPVFLLGAIVTDVPGGGGMSWMGVLQLLLAATTLVSGFSVFIRANHGWRNTKRRKGNVMNRLLIIGLLTGILLGTAGCGRQSDSSVTQLETRPRAVEYFRASHGFDGGLQEMVDLSKREGFDAIRTIDDVARFASEVPSAVGFTAHPDFENGTRYASAVMWYTKLSPTESSWVLYLFDKKEAQKHPGDAPRAAAVTAAEAKVSSQIDQARELIAAGGTNGVKVVGDPDECKALALAVLRLGGLFAHTGEFAVGRCVECRNVVPGGNPGACGLGVQNKKHWNCCGSTNEGGYCDYWKLIKARDDRK